MHFSSDTCVIMNEPSPAVPKIVFKLFLYLKIIVFISSECLKLDLTCTSACQGWSLTHRLFSRGFGFASRCMRRGNISLSLLDAIWDC